MKALHGKKKKTGGIDWMEKRRKARKVFDRIKGPISEKLFGKDLTKEIHKRDRDFDAWFTSQNHSDRLIKYHSVDDQFRKAGYDLMRATKVLEHILGKFDEAYGQKDVHDFAPAFFGDDGEFSMRHLNSQIEQFFSLAAKINLDPPQNGVKDITPHPVGEIEG